MTSVENTRNIPIRFLLAGILAWMASGCALPADYKRPQVDIPDRWLIDYQSAVDMSNGAWWEQFGDPVLNSLIKSALNENKDVRIATARVEEFAGRLKTIRSGFFPQIGYGVSEGGESISLEKAIPFVDVIDRTHSLNSVGVNLSWELDVWGRLQRATEAARADLLSEAEARQAVILGVVSAVAAGYIDLLSLDERLNTAKRTLTSRGELLHLFERKFEGGDVSALELAQVRASYEGVAESIPDTERRIALLQNSLSVLAGQNPGIIARGNMEALIMPEIPQGVPSDLLARRPDIRQAEQDLIAANARVGVARLQYFPAISLTGLFGYASSSLSDLLVSSANQWQAGADALGVIFDAGKIKGDITTAEAIQQQLLNKYLSAIQNAFREVDDSLVTIQKQRELLAVQVRHISALKDNVHFAYARYDEKLASYLEIVDAERNLFDAEIGHIQTQVDLFSAIVDSYKAMGGGWVAAADKLIAQPASAAAAADPIK